MASSNNGSSSNNTPTPNCAQPTQDQAHILKRGQLWRVGHQYCWPVYSQQPCMPVRSTSHPCYFALRMHTDSSPYLCEQNIAHIRSCKSVCTLEHMHVLARHLQMWACVAFDICSVQDQRQLRLSSRIMMVSSQLQVPCFTCKWRSTLTSDTLNLLISARSCLCLPVRLCLLVAH